MDTLYYILIALAFLLGLVVGLAARGRRYLKAVKTPSEPSYDGFLNVSANETNRLYEFDPTSEADNWADQEHVIFKVRKV